MTVQKQIVELLIRLKQSGSLSFLLICHDLALVQRLCDTVLVLQHGKAVEYGETQQVLLHPQQEYTKRLIASVL